LLSCIDLSHVIAITVELLMNGGMNSYGLYKILLFLTMLDEEYQSILNEDICLLASLCGSVGKDFVYHACGHEFETRLEVIIEVWLSGSEHTKIRRLAQQ